MTHNENYDRALWQSARTKDGHRAELPYDYARAWPAAHEEDRGREYERDAIADSVPEGWPLDYADRRGD